MQSTVGISEDDEDDDEDDDNDLFVNPNHQKTTCYVESESSDDSDDEQWHPIEIHAPISLETGLGTFVKVVLKE